MNNDVKEPLGLGTFIGLSDKEGQPVQIGDTLEFDPTEWGKEHTFVVELIDGQIQHSGATSDLPQFCRIIRKWSDESDLQTALIDIEDGRFKNIINALEIKEVCGECDHFNLSIQDPREGYRCKCTPSCIAATLNTSVISYLNYKLGWIDELAHFENLGINRGT